jgi:hypothetical protein
MQRLTLEEAVGQTLLAKYEMGEDTLLRFTGGYVTLCTHYESYTIMDYTDGDAPLRESALSRKDDDDLDALCAGGFIDTNQKIAAKLQRDANSKAYEEARRESLRQQYEQLRKMFEPE